MVATALRVLLNPKGFFADRMGAEERLKAPALIVLAAGIIGAVSAYLVAGPIVHLLPAEAQAVGAFIPAYPPPSRSSAPF